MKKSKFNIYHSEKPYFVANTLTGACILLSREELSDLQNEGIGNFSNNELEILKERGILIESSLDEIGLLRNAYNQCKYDSYKATITIAPSLGCNFDCIYCYEKKDAHCMSKEVQDASVEFIKKMLVENHIKELHICWYGGEPLLCLKIIEKMSEKLINICAENNISYQASIITNGYLVTEESAVTLKKIKVKNAQVTVDGSAITHNKRRMLIDGKSTYNEVCGGILLLASNDIHVAVRVNLDKSNIKEYKDVSEKFNSVKNVTCYPAVVT